MPNKRYAIVKLPIFLLAFVWLSGCQAPASVTQMQAENASLERELAAAKDEITALKAHEKDLQSRVEELDRVAAVLDTEKTSRVAESSKLRRQIRQFVQRHIDALKAFMVEGNLLDYVGSALIERAHEHTPVNSEALEPLLLVDFANPIPAAGVLTGVGGIATAATDIEVKVLRKIDQQWLVVWSSQPLSFALSGFNRESFRVNVGVEKGDLVAYYFPRSASISFDTGTGQTLFRRDDISIGGLLNVNSLDGQSQQRAYSLGVYGLLRD